MANGYVTTVTYSGEIVSSGIEAVVYTLTYVGEPIPIPAAAWADILRYIAYALLLLLLLAGIAFAVMTLLFNTKVYTLKEDGVEYELISKQWLKTKEPVIDLRKTKKYPKDEATIEISSRTARRIFGRIVRIYLRDGVVRTPLTYIAEK